MTDRLFWWIYWFFFKWNLSAVKWKAGIIIPTIWIVDTLFFTGLISIIWLGIFLGIIALIALIPSIPTAVGVADKLNLVNLSEEQSIIRRFFSLIFSDVAEYVEMVIEYLFGD